MGLSDFVTAGYFIGELDDRPKWMCAPRDFQPLARTRLDDLKRDVLVEEPLAEILLDFGLRMFARDDEPPSVATEWVRHLFGEWAERPDEKAPQYRQIAEMDERRLRRLIERVRQYHLQAERMTEKAKARLPEAEDCGELGWPYVFRTLARARAFAGSRSIIGLSTEKWRAYPFIHSGWSPTGNRAGIVNVAARLEAPAQGRALGFDALCFDGSSCTSFLMVASEEVHRELRLKVNDLGFLDSSEAAEACATYASYELERDGQWRPWCLTVYESEPAD